VICEQHGMVLAGQCLDGTGKRLVSGRKGGKRQSPDPHYKISCEQRQGVLRVDVGEQTDRHVVILAETPRLDPSGAFYVVRVYDSAAEAHFDDTREPGGQPSPTGTTGVGSGFINVKVDGQGRPIAYLFAPPANAQYSYRPIAIGRVEPLERQRAGGPRV
jgi:hypothetical protein